MVSAMDHALGKIVHALRKTKMYRKTIFVFMSDVSIVMYMVTLSNVLQNIQNGGSPFKGGSNHPLKGRKGTLWEGGTRSPAFVHAPYILKRSGEISQK